MLRRCLITVVFLLLAGMLRAQEATVYVAYKAKQTPRVATAGGELTPMRMHGDTLRTGGVCFIRLPKLELFLCIGQSNMAGRGTLEACYLDTLQNGWLLNADNRFEPAVNPLNRYSTIRKEMPMQRVGLTYGFAKSYSAETGAQVGLVVNARGDTSIDKWLPGADAGYFEEAVKRIRAAREWGEVKAVLWHQGEADCAHPERYEAKLRRIVDALRAELGGVPFVFGEIAHWNWTRRPEGTAPFNAMLGELPKRISRSACVSSEGLQPYKDETDPHFSAASQVVLGGRYAEAILQLTQDKPLKTNP